MENGLKLHLHKRIAVCFFVIVILLFVCFLRVCAITLSPKYKVSSSQGHFYTLDAGNVRGTIFDRNMHPLTNQSEKIMAAVLPTPRTLTVLKTVLNDDEMGNVTKKFKLGKPFLIKLREKVDCEGITCFSVPENTSKSQPAMHLVGYCDEAGHGITGLQKAFDDILFLKEKTTVSYATDGHSNVLKGVESKLKEGSSHLNSGVITTLDINFQKILEESVNSIKKGCALISDCKTGEILGAVSLPSYDLTNLADAINANTSPLLNRILCSYNIGSVFKPCVSVSAITDGSVHSFSHTCNGNVFIDKHTFNCHKLSGHGKVNHGEALAFSCNTFFYNLGLMTGATNLFNTATVFGFGSSVSLCEGLSTFGENLTNLKTLKNSKSALLNLAIGQGELLASPLTMLNLYSAIANGGIYHTPTLIKSTVQNGKITEEKNFSPTKAMSKDCANIIKNYLNTVVESGTGMKAKPTNTTAAGKTATAETGWKNENGNFVLQSWFCGFFPLETPKYTVIILAEDSVSGGEDCAPVFKAIAEKITEAGY